MRKKSQLRENNHRARAPRTKNYHAPEMLLEIPYAETEGIQEKGKGYIKVREIGGTWLTGSY